MKTFKISQIEKKEKKKKINYTSKMYYFMPVNFFSKMNLLKRDLKT